jgi:hypothetical protein
MSKLSAAPSSLLHPSGRFLDATRVGCTSFGDGDNDACVPLGTLSNPYKKDANATDNDLKRRARNGVSM